jgi:hypothetical protein
MSLRYQVCEGATAGGGDQPQVCDQGQLQPDVRGAHQQQRAAGVGDVAQPQRRAGEQRGRHLHLHQRQQRRYRLRSSAAVSSCSRKLLAEQSSHPART